MFAKMMVSALALTGVAYAQEQTPAAQTTDATATPAASGRVSYDTAFFAQFNPQTALDMVRQTPGFALDAGEERRGFSGAVGNLLIDGLRPSAKSQDLETILSRIPATQVVRIEVLRGAEVAGDASGQSVLVNIVRTPSAGSGVYQVGLEYTSREIVAPRAEISYSGRNGQTEYGIGASLHTEARDLPGYRRIFDAPGGNQIGFVDTPAPREYREGSLSANAATPLLGGRISATGQIDAWRFHSRNDFLSFDSDGVNTSNVFAPFEEVERTAELGVNYDREFGPWSLALVALANRTLYESSEVATELTPAGDFSERLSQSVENESGESILRAALSRALTPQHRIELGVEGAVNTLDASSELTQDLGAGPELLLIPNANVNVEEERAELFGVHTWTPNDRWSLESRIARETSTLTFTGDANQAVELSFWKPSVQLSRTIGENNQVRFRAYRDVGQLDFGDFVSAAGIADDLINGGNPNLRPETAWRAEIGADLRFPGDAALSLTLTRHWIEDAADMVQIVVPGQNPGDPPIRFDAPGNIGDGEATSLEANLSLPLNWLLPNSRLTVEGNLWNIQVTDPVTGQSRTASERPESEIQVSFRQDFPARRLAWGVELQKQGEYQYYRFNEIDTQEEGPWIDLWVETTALPHGMKLRAWAANIGNGDVRRTRLFSSPDRTGPFSRYEIRERAFASAPWLILELSGTF